MMTLKKLLLCKVSLTHLSQVQREIVLTCRRNMDEVRKARMAVPPSTNDGTNDTIFGKILRREIPCTFIYEDNECVAFNDLNPQAPVHFLVIPKKAISMLDNVAPEDKQLLGHLLVVAKNISQQMGLKNGYRTVINNGPDGCQSVYHLHIHVMGGRQMQWPPG